MASFKDTNGKEWNLKLDAPTVLAVRKELDGLDLVAVDGRQFDRLLDDPIDLIEACWILCRKQAERDQITYERFADVMTGDVLDGATAAMLEAVTDFFPPARRKLIKEVAERAQALRQGMIDRAMTILSDPELEQRLLAEVDRRLNEALTPPSSATSSPDSSESAPKD